VGRSAIIARPGIRLPAWRGAVCWARAPCVLGRGDAMAIDASGVLGSRQLAGVKVNPQGYAWRMARNQSGTLAAGIVLGGQPHPGRAETPHFGRLAFLAVTDQELALVKLRPRKVVMLKAAEVIARVPRSQLQTAELGCGYVAPLAIIFASGGTWRLEVPPPSKRYARVVVHALGGRVITRNSLPPGPAPRMSGYRILCGAIWAVIALGMGAGGVAELSIGNIAGAILCFVIAVPAGWYDYRIWTLKARRLFLIL
jgi:hypothetical protein